MDTLLEFFLSNFIWVIIVALIIIFALIGYLVDITIGTQKKEKKKKSVNPIEDVKDDAKVVHPSLEIYTNDVFDKPLMEDKN